MSYRLKEVHVSKIRLFLTMVASLTACSVLWGNLVAAPRYGPWSTPVNLGTPVNSAFAENKATLSKNGLSLYFSSNRPCGDDDTVIDANLWVAHRSWPDGVWDSVECLNINVNPTLAGETVIEDSAPALSRDEHWLYFVSDRPGSFGSPGFFGRDIWASWRADVHDDQAWEQPINVGSPVNTTAAEAGPAYFENEGGVPQLFFTSTRSGLSGVFDIWVADVLNGAAAGPARRVDEVNTASLVEAGPAIRHDGLELFFFRGAPGSLFDIYAATRTDPASPWSDPVNQATVNSPASEQAPSISSDRETLFVPSNRPGSILAPTGQPSMDIWVSTRSKASEQ